MNKFKIVNAVSLPILMPTAGSISDIICYLTNACIKSSVHALLHQL